VLAVLHQQFGVLLPAQKEKRGRSYRARAFGLGRCAFDLGLLDDVSPFKKTGVCLEPQTRVPDIQANALEPKVQKEKTLALKGKGAFGAADPPQHNLEHGLYA